MASVINNDFELGDIVCLATDPDQAKRMVTAIIMRGNSLIYELSCGTVASTHVEKEINKDKIYSYG